MNQIFDIFRESLVITSFIFGMMLFVEYLTVQTKDKFTSSLSRNPWIQVIIGTLLGLIPGCLGSYFGVTLYVHNALNFAGLTAMMIATSGDEAFAMLSIIPDKFLLINGILLVVALVTGFVLNIVYHPRRPLIPEENNLLHAHYTNPQCYCFDRKKVWGNITHMTIYRGLLSLALIALIGLEIAGLIGPEKWYFRYSLIIIFAFALFVVVTVPEHFLKDHIWRHIVIRHLGKIFLWIFGVMFFLQIIMPYLNISEETLSRLSSQYYWLVLLIAVLMGILPESGPHLIFIILLSKGIVPLSVVVANSISQDGHGSLPLLAESGRSFVVMKAINIFVALIVGLGLHMFGL